MVIYEILLITNSFNLQLDVVSILENPIYQVKTISINSIITVEILKKQSFNMVILDCGNDENIECLKIGNYLINSKKNPFIYILPKLNSVKLEKIFISRPTGIIFKPLDKYEFNVTVTLVLNNTLHKNINFATLDENQLTEYSLIFNNVLEYINSNIKKSIEIENLVDLTPWTYDYFIKKFKKSMKITPYQYILLKKIQKSKAYIVGTDLPITEIAIIFSFESYSSFTNAFNKTYGSTPSQYRSKCKVDFYFEKNNY